MPDAITDNPKTDAPGNAAKDPDDWTTGDEPMTGAQASYLKTLSEEADEDFDPNLSKTEASRRALPPSVNLAFTARSENVPAAATSRRTATGPVPPPKGHGRGSGPTQRSRRVAPRDADGRLSRNARSGREAAPVRQDRDARELVGKPS